MELAFPETPAPLDPRAEEEWRDVWNRLRYFTYLYYYWLPSRVSGVDLDDVVQEACLAALAGKRRRPPNIELLKFLNNVVRSKVSHLPKGEQKITSIEDTPLALTATSGEFPQPVRLEEKARQDAYRQMCERLRELVSCDKDLLRIVDLLLANPDFKPRDIVRELNMTASELRNAQKRLSRRAKKLWEGWKDVNGRS